MRQQIFSDFEPRHAELWGKHTVRLHHRLAELPILQEDYLAEIIERAPQSTCPVNTMAGDGFDANSWTYCDRTGVSGMEVLQALKNGRLWINLWEIEKYDDRFAQLLNDVYDELAEYMPEFRPYRKSMGVLISSPGAQVFYHADVPGQSLWQIKGRKRLYLYPAEEPFLKPEEIENVIRGVTEEDITYEPWFDDYAQIVDLEAGDMMHWKLNAPHRVINSDCINISITTEHWLPETRRSFAMNYGNGLLRNVAGITPKSRALSGPAFWGKVGLTAAWRLSGMQKRQSFKRVLKYRVDPNSETGLTPVALAAE